LFHYCTYGLHLQSDLPLPELTPVEVGTCDVRIRLHSGRSPNGRVVGENEDRLFWEEVGTFLVSRGETITIYPHDGVDLPLIRLPLLGPVLGTLLHQRGRVVLHASAVAIEGRAVGFVGHKGYGKSTTAAALHARGHALVTDDLLPIVLDEDAGPTTRPGYARLSLWPDAATAVGKDPSALEALHERVHKKAVPVSAETLGALPLDVIYVLAQGSQLEICEFTPRESFLELLRYSYCRDRLNRLARSDLLPTFRRYTQLAEAVPVRRLVRPRDLTALPDIARTVEDDLRGTVPSLDPEDSPAEASVFW